MRDMTAIVPAYLEARARNATRYAARMCTVCGLRPMAVRDGYCVECYARMWRAPLKVPRERALLDAQADKTCCGGKDYNGDAAHRAGCYALKEDW